MSVPPAEMPIRRRILRALARGLTVKRAARLYGLPADFVAGIAAGRVWKTARRRGIRKGIAACRDGNGRVAAPSLESSTTETQRHRESETAAPGAPSSLGLCASVVNPGSSP